MVINVIVVVVVIAVIACSTKTGKFERGQSFAPDA
jgi:hypothetical protein